MAVAVGYFSFVEIFSFTNPHTDYSVEQSLDFEK